MLIASIALLDGIPAQVRKTAPCIQSVIRSVTCWQSHEYPPCCACELTSTKHTFVRHPCTRVSNNITYHRTISHITTKVPATVGSVLCMVIPAADPGGGHSGHVPPPPPPPFINKFITFRAAFYNIAARLRCLLISARMNSTTVLYPGPPDTRSYSPPPRPSYRARNQQHPPPPPRSSFWARI